MSLLQYLGGYMDNLALDQEFYEDELNITPELQDKWIIEAYKERLKKKDTQDTNNPGLLACKVTKYQSTIITE